MNCDKSMIWGKYVWKEFMNKNLLQIIRKKNNVFLYFFYILKNKRLRSRVNWKDSENVRNWTNFNRTFLGLAVILDKIINIHSVDFSRFTYELFRISPTILPYLYYSFNKYFFGLYIDSSGRNSAYRYE